MMKVPTIAQAQANVERMMQHEKRNGSRKRVSRQSSIDKKVAAEARRLEMLQAAENVGMLDPSISEQMRRPRSTGNIHNLALPDAFRQALVPGIRKKRLPHHKLLAEWHKELGSKPDVPRTLAEVNRALLELKRQSLELQRECVALQQEVYKLLKKE